MLGCQEQATRGAYFSMLPEFVQTATIRVPKEPDKWRVFDELSDRGAETVWKGGDYCVHVE